jgi:hypothetical protein
MKYNSRELSQDLYDLIKVNALHEDQDDKWSKLCRQFAKDAERNLHQLTKDKNMEWNGELEIIKIGRDIIVKVIWKGDQK